MNITDNIEIYFICNDLESELITSEYDEEQNTHYWYFNCYLAYKEWQNKFKNIKGDLIISLLTVAASRYLIYQIENKKYKNKGELNTLKKELKKINPELEKIITENNFLQNL